MTKFSFSKKFILKNKKDYINLLNNLDSIRLKFNYIKTVFNFNNYNYSRLGFLLKKKYIKKSYVRNLFKRILREFFRYNIKNLKNIDIIIISNKFINKLNKKILLIDMNNLLFNIIKY